MNKRICIGLVLIAAALAGCGGVKDNIPHAVPAVTSAEHRDGDILWYTPDGYAACVYVGGEYVMVELIPEEDPAWDRGMSGWVYDGPTRPTESVG